MKVLSNNRGLVNFAIGLVNSVQASTVYWEFKFTEVLYDKLKTPNRLKWTKRRFSS